jgi:phage baseplate assembly protein V
MTHAILGELDRRLANIVRVGTIKELDEANARVKVDLGDLTTDWLPWGTARSGGDRSWSAHEVGEQVMLFAPSGELAAACVMGSIPQDAHPAPANSKDHTRYEWSDGAFQDYDRAGHHYVLDIPSAGDLTLHVGAATLVLKNSDITAKIGGTTLKLVDGTATLTTNQLTVNAPQSNFNGNVTISGALSYAGGLTGSGGSGASLNGPLTVVGNVDTTGTLKNNTKDVGSTHKHVGVQTGGGTTGTPQ